MYGHLSPMQGHALLRNCGRHSPAAVSIMDNQVQGGRCVSSCFQVGGTCALPIQARQQSRPEATGGAPGVLELTSSSTVLPM